MCIERSVNHSCAESKACTNHIQSIYLRHKHESVCALFKY